MNPLYSFASEFGIKREEELMKYLDEKGVDLP